MDELILKLSTFGLKSFVGNLVRHTISTKAGIDTDISLNDLDVELKDGVVKAHLNVDVCLPKNELMKILKSAKFTSAVMDKT